MELFLDESCATDPMEVKLVGSDKQSVLLPWRLSGIQCHSHMLWHESWHVSVPIMSEQGSVQNSIQSWMLLQAVI